MLHPSLGYTRISVTFYMYRLCARPWNTLNPLRARAEQQGRTTQSSRGCITPCRHEKHLKRSRRSAIYHPRSQREPDPARSQHHAQSRWRGFLMSRIVVSQMNQTQSNSTIPIRSEMLGSWSLQPVPSRRLALALHPGKILEKYCSQCVASPAFRTDPWTVRILQ